MEGQCTALRRNHMSALAALEEDVRTRLAENAGRLLVVGVSGAQGSGKSTLAAALVTRLCRDRIAAAALSLDDLYLTKTERRDLARKVHPLLATRGVPGTHDVALGLATIEALERGEPALLPRFDKGADDRVPKERWDKAPFATQVLVLEGWCLGARPQPAEALRSPVNTLEAEEDGDGQWRAHVNAALAGDYATLFRRIDLLAMLEAPAFDVVQTWRAQQEEPLQQQGLGMDAPALARFIAHYERLTRHMLREMPPRADLLLRLNADRTVREVRRRTAAAR